MRLDALRNMRRIAFLSIGFVFYLLFFISFSEAAFYEVRGKLTWQGTAFRKANAYLLSDTPQASVNKNDSQQAVEKNFREEYSALEKERNNALSLSDKKLAKEARKKIKRGIDDLINKYRERTVSLDKKGEFYLNVSPGAHYHIFVLKNEGLLTRTEGTNFWLQNIYFKPGDVLSPQEYNFNESNIITW